MTKPYEIEIAKTGEAIATNGQKVSFTEQMLSDAAKSYNPLTFQAPLIITHDTKGIPDKKLAASPFSYGRPDYLRVVGDRLKAVFAQKIDPRIIRWFKNGNLLGISPSFYPPSHSHNPTPGVYHLRHIAALGKEPPSMKGLEPVSFSEVDDDVLDFMLPPEAALDFSCGCDTQDPAIVSLLIGLREYLIAEKDLDVANKVLPHSAIERARAEATDSKAAIARLDELEKELEIEMEAMGEDSTLNDPDSFIQSYQETITPKKNKATTKKRSTKQTDVDLAMLNEPLNEDTDVLDDWDKYDQFDDDEEEEESPKAKAKKTKSKPKKDEDEEVDDYAESRLRRELRREIRQLEANFAERIEREEHQRKQQAYEFAEQRSELERQLAEQQLQNLAQQCEVESKLLEFEEAKEQNRLESITQFVDGLVEAGVQPHLVGEIGLDFAETEDGEDAVWDLADFMASLDDVQLEFAEKFIGAMADALQDSQSAIDYSEGDDGDRYAGYSPPEPNDVLGIKAPAGVNISPQAQADAQALVDFAESRGYDLSNKAQFKKAYKELRSSY